jgi:hypothetical protein
MLSGGKLYDEGMYGCIFTPPLQCSKDTQKQLAEEGVEILSKLILAPAAQHEYAIGSNIRKIPLWKIILLYRNLFVLLLLSKRSEN